MISAFARHLNTVGVRRVLNVAQKLTGIAAVVFLGVKLYHIGWADLWAALPW